MWSAFIIPQRRAVNGRSQLPTKKLKGEFEQVAADFLTNRKRAGPPDKVTSDVNFMRKTLHGRVSGYIYDLHGRVV